MEEEKVVERKKVLVAGHNCYWGIKLEGCLKEDGYEVVLLNSEDTPPVNELIRDHKKSQKIKQKLEQILSNQKPDRIIITSQQNIYVADIASQHDFPKNRIIIYAGRKIDVEDELKEGWKEYCVVEKSGIKRKDSSGEYHVIVDVKGDYERGIADILRQD